MSETKFLTKRPFNQGAYDECDSNAKNTVVEIMKRLGYSVHGNLKEENYKKYDLNFFNESTQKFFAVENEVRRDFDAIRDRFDTVHIPVRKSNTQMDCYFVWNRNVNQVIVIDRITFLKYVKNLVDVDCDSEVLNGDKIAYQEKFIDVPKHECKFYFLVGDYKLSDRVVSHEISGFLNYP